MKLALTECLFSGRIITLLGGERHSKQIINVSALMRLMPPESLGTFRGFYSANRDLNILLAEKHFGSKRGKSISAAINKQLDRLFADIVNTNDLVLHRLKKM